MNLLISILPCFSSTFFIWKEINNKMEGVIMWRDYPKDYVEEAWKNSKRKIDFMEKLILAIVIIEPVKEQSNFSI